MRPLPFTEHSAHRAAARLRAQGHRNTEARLLDLPRYARSWNGRMRWTDPQPTWVVEIDWHGRPYRLLGVEDVRWFEAEARYEGQAA